MLLSCTAENIKIAAQKIADGGLVAFPTETVYGLGADAFNKDAVTKIFAAKNRPFFDPLIVHIASLRTLDRLVAFNAMTSAAKRNLEALCEALWPGPLTLVLPKQGEVPLLTTGGLETVAVRFPNNKDALSLIELSTGAVAAPSANPFGYLSPTRAEHVLSQLGDKVDIILDGGKTCVGIESTVLDLTLSVPRILRQGGTAQEKIEELSGALAALPDTHKKAAVAGSPGMLKSHYAPRTKLLLHSSCEMTALPFVEHEAYLFFDAASCNEWKKLNGRGADSVCKNSFVLSEEGEANEAAANLFDYLHTIDMFGWTLIHAQRAANAGLGRAINDRLERARS